MSCIERCPLFRESFIKSGRFHFKHHTPSSSTMKISVTCGSNSTSASLKLSSSVNDSVSSLMASGSMDTLTHCLLSAGGSRVLAAEAATVIGPAAKIKSDKSAKN